MENYILPKKQAIVVFFVFAFGYFLSCLLRAITATLSPVLTSEFNLLAADLGLLAGGYFLGFACMQIPLGYLLDKYGPKKIVSSFLLIALVGTGSFALAESFSGLLVSRILIGVGVSACLMAPLTGYRIWYAENQQQRANSWMLMIASLGFLSSTLPVQLLLPSLGWRWIFGGIAILILISIFLMLIFIPKWRLDSQRLIREKQLTLRRLKALMDIVSENDDMKADAEIIHEKYKFKLATLDEMESEIKSKLEERLIELDTQMKSAKMLSFDAKVQFKSNEISEATFETVKSCTTEVIEHVTHEQSEISNVKSRIADLELEVQEITSPAEANIQESAVTYLETPEPQQVIQTILPEAPTEPIVTPSEPIEAQVSPIPEPPTESEVTFAFPEPPQQVTSETSHDDNDNDWLARMEAQ